MIAGFLHVFACKGLIITCTHLPPGGSALMMSPVPGQYSASLEEEAKGEEKKNTFRCSHFRLSRKNVQNIKSRICTEVQVEPWGLDESYSAVESEKL